MTTFQDPPPQSRRAVRQIERGETAAEQTPPTPDQGTPYSFDAPAEPARTDSGASENGGAPAAAPQSGRRAQGRVPAPSEGVTSQPLSGQPAPGSGYPTQAAPTETAEQRAFRLRDFSPEGGRRVAPPVQDGPTSPTANFAPPARPAELDYQTQTVVPGAAHAAPPAPLDDNLNHTLSRRELREMRAAAEAQAPALQAPAVNPVPESIDTLLNSGPIEIPTLAPPPGQSQALAEAMAEFDLLTRSRREAEARARDAQVASLATPIVPQAVAPAVEAAPAQPFPFGQASAPQPASVASAPVASAPVAPAPVASAPVASVPVASVPVASVPVAPVASVPAPQTSAPEAPAAELSFDQLTSAPVAPEVSTTDEEPAPTLDDLFGLQVDEVETSVPQEQEASAAPASAPEPPAASWPTAEATTYPPTASLPSTPDPLANLAEPPMLPAPRFDDIVAASAPQPVEVTPVFPQPVVPVPVVPVPVAQVPVAEQPTQQPSAPDEQDEHGGRSPRASGHWRVQAALEDDDLPFENTLSRTVGSNTSAITTSALVLPSVPQPDGIMTNLTATGEILVTGSIDLPRSLGSTGAHPNRIDTSDFEDDPFDSQVAAPDSAPVRAIRAISTNTSTRGIIETKKPAGTRLLTGVIIVASVLCISLVGLLVYAFATNKL